MNNQPESEKIIPFVNLGSFEGQFEQLVNNGTPIEVLRNMLLEAELDKSEPSQKRAQEMRKVLQQKALVKAQIMRRVATHGEAREFPEQVLASAQASIMGFDLDTISLSEIALQILASQESDWKGKQAPKFLVLAKELEEHSPFK